MYTKNLSRHEVSELKTRPPLMTRSSQDHSQDNSQGLSQKFPQDPPQNFLQSWPQNHPQNLPKNLPKNLQRSVCLFVQDLTECAIVMLSSHGLIQFWNQGAQQLFGYSQKEVFGVHFSKLFDKTDHPAFHPTLQTTLQENEIETYSHCKRKDGTLFPSRYEMRIIYTEQGNLEGFGIVFSDLSDLEKTQEQLFKERKEHDIIFNTVPAMIWYKDRENRILHCNRRAAESVGKVPSELKDWPTQEIYPEDAQQYHTDDLEVITTGKPKLGIIEPYSYTSQFRGWVQTDKIPSFDSDGNICGVVVFAVDITKRKQAEDRIRFISQGSQLLSSTIDYRETLKHVARLAVPFFADWCIVDLIEPDQTIKRVEVTSRFSSKADLASKLMEFSPRWKTNSPIIQVLEKNEAVIIVGTNLKDDIRCFKFTQSEEHEQCIRELNPKMAILAPLNSGNRSLGVLTFILTEHGRKYSEDDLPFAMEIASRAAVSIDHARLFYEAQAAIKLRDEFMSIASHELKTPLTSGILQLQLIKKLFISDPQFKVSNDKIRTLLKMLEEDLHRESALINNLMDLTRIQSGQMILEKEKINLGNLIEGLLTRFREVQNGNGSPIVTQLPKNIIGYWDRLRVEQVFTNLISNAIKYGLDKPIEVSASIGSTSVQIHIRDQGIGISQDKQAAIFEPFNRATKRKGEISLGLGLYISKQIVAEHGGTITLQSRVGLGSTFSVQLPL